MKAVVLLSGGLDSATVLAQVVATGYKTFVLSIDYGQRHQSEMLAVKRLIKSLAITEALTFSVPLTQIGGSALTDNSIDVPVTEKETAEENGIPMTYVPARNTIFLSIALAWAEVIGARDIFIGANEIDYAGYPDCRPEYFSAFNKLASYATRAGREGKKITVHAPLLGMKKSEIIQLGIELGVDYALTISCYQSDIEGRACGICAACKFRKQGFIEAGVNDPTQYIASYNV